MKSLEAGFSSGCPDECRLVQRRIKNDGRALFEIDGWFLCDGKSGFGNLGQSLLVSVYRFRGIEPLSVGVHELVSLNDHTQEAWDPISLIGGWRLGTGNWGLGLSLFVASLFVYFVEVREE